MDLKGILARNSTNSVCLRTSLCFILIFEAILDGSRNVGWQLSSAMPLKTSVPAYVVFYQEVLHAQFVPPCELGLFARADFTTFILAWIYYNFIIKCHTVPYEREELLSNTLLCESLLL